VAEGAETEALRAYLAEHGCDIMQGCLIAKPLTPEEAEAYLARR
jgi:EAL domain-containing protein (putative c-di-GMP-specific phosphodiesterase class I)